MNRIITGKVRIAARVTRRLLHYFRDFPYDLWRWLVYSGWFDIGTNSAITEYRGLMIAHGVEKGLSYSERTPGRGRQRFIDLKEFLDSYGDTVAPSVFTILDDVSAQYESTESNRKPINDRNLHANFCYSDAELDKFFKMRRSQREYDERPIELSQIRKIIDLARFTPSVCNRQSAKVYYSLDQKLIQKFLNYQSGNSPWSSKLSCLLVVTADQRAFFGSNERYQHYIDGGLFSMQIINAAHAMGLATCALNWSQHAHRDRKVRRIFNIENSHSIIMCIAIGNYTKRYQPCKSERKQIDHFLRELK